MACNVFRLCWIYLISTCVRLCFGVFSLICIYLVTVSRKDPYYWLLTLSIIPIAVETTYYLSRRHKRPCIYRWLSPSIFFFLVASLPSMILLEWDYLDDHVLVPSNMSWSSMHHQQQIDSTFVIGLLEQAILALLIGGRLFLLQGELSVDRVLILLLHHIVTACDILEINEILRERSDNFDQIVILSIVVALGLSILQFSIQPGDLMMLGSFNRQNMRDLWLLCAPACLVESCFFALRMVFIIRYGLLTYPLFFYAAKNIVAIIMESSLLFSVLCSIRPCLSLSSLVSINSATRHSVSAPSIESEGQQTADTRSVGSVSIAIDSKGDLSLDQSSIRSRGGTSP